MKTGDGTIDGLGNIIGQTGVDYREGAEEAMKHFEENKAKAEKEAALKAPPYVRTLTVNAYCAVRQETEANMTRF